MRKLHLPISIAEHPVAQKLGEYISSMGPSSSYLSTIVYDDGKNKKFLTKDEDFPFVEFDWFMYCVMRTNAKTWITSGYTMRKQPKLFDDSRGTFGNKELIKLFQDNVHDKINVVVYTRQMSQKDLMSIVTDKYFNVIPMQELAPHQPTLQNIIETVASRQLGPTIIENGVNTMRQTLIQAEKKGKCLLDMMILSVFEGDMPQKYISEDFITQWLQKHMQIAYQSPKFDTKVKQGDTIKSATLKFIVFLKKIQKS